MFYVDRIIKGSSSETALREFLLERDVIYEDLDSSYVIRDEGEIIATVSVKKNLIKFFYIDDKYQGEGLAIELINSALEDIIAKGYRSYFVFTKAKNENIFTSLSMDTIEKTEDVVLLEGGFFKYADWIEIIKKDLDKDEYNAIVMNANPLTLGHEYLVDKALENDRDLIIFVLEEDASYFSTRDRYEIVKKHYQDNDRVHVYKSGPYIISRATFPTYFLKKDTDKLKVYTELDAKIFARRIAKDLNIKKRYFGTEPIDKVTQKYNEMMMKILSEYGIATEFIERKTIDGEVISASKVRECYENDFSACKKYLSSDVYELLEIKRSGNND
ncbi:GNAT family N-acetyltransferase [Fenollaria timonensis]|uniref:GNAT family N-acetyltransferase n=1 Tax=Fenollaria timonensis TaxID=1723384 RepID=UPI00071CD51A|nr:GNAT family N-acetyltransferase [Fenollaria timonensis]